LIKSQHTLHFESVFTTQQESIMSKTSLPQNLPFLPGNVYGDPTITRYHKTQLLGVKDGVITGKLTRTLQNG
jgi:hypothetical protein